MSFDEDHRSGAAGKRLQPHRTGTGEEVEQAGAVDAFAAQDAGLPAPAVTKEIEALLLEYDWPGRPNRFRWHRNLSRFVKLCRHRLYAPEIEYAARDYPG